MAWLAKSQNPHPPVCGFTVPENWNWALRSPQMTA
jgi:hypothetical protein